MQVTGTITPAACTPTQGNGGTVDFGTTSTSEIIDTKIELENKSVALNVVCTGATKLSFNVVDNRAGTVVANLTNFPAGLADFGPGKTNDDKDMGLTLFTRKIQLLTVWRVKSLVRQTK
ncbi:DUF1120 domain-containing protein [Buttiauxella sp.]|uniref:DUF1120 domain-containing protein n=1 Tax=Buttiauxella sp. TaxID=1972222 RepID=UPI003C7088F7